MNGKISVIQMKYRGSRQQSLFAAQKAIRRAAFMGADFAVLPEMFACPYDTGSFPAFSETADGETVGKLSDTARENGIYVVGGSIPELADGGKIYNTSFVFGRDGKVIARHRKVHLFDVNIKNGQYFRESDILSPGKVPTVFSTEFGVMGLCICFDIRFPEMFFRMRKKGAVLVFCPAAFNKTTGPKHWELLFRARAVDNQIFMIGAAPAADETASYVSYGHSICVSPWGDVIAQAGEEETFLDLDIDFSMVSSVREQIPLFYRF